MIAVPLHDGMVDPVVANREIDDPEYADTLIVRPVAGLNPAKDVMTRAEEAARKALELDPLLAEAHNTSGAVCLFFKWNWKCADAETARAIELDPSLAEPHHLRSYVMLAMNRYDEAIQEQKRAMELDPFQRPWALGFTYLLTGRFDDAVKELKIRSEATSDNVYVRSFLSKAFFHRGLERETFEELQKAYMIAGETHSSDEVSRLYDKGGMKAVSQFRLGEIRDQAKTSYVSPLELSHAYARLGDRQQTLKYLDDAVRERTPMLIFLQAEPDYAFLRHDSRFQQIAKQIGLPPLR